MPLLILKLLLQTQVMKKAHHVIELPKIYRMHVLILKVIFYVRMYVRRQVMGLQRKLCTNAYGSLLQ